MVDVRLLALVPGRLRMLVGVRARVHDVRDGVTEAPPDAGQGLGSALVLDGVVEQRGDHLLL
jgi:hypothetical protein